MLQIEEALGFHRLAHSLLHRRPIVWMDIFCHPGFRGFPRIGKHAVAVGFDHFRRIRVHAEG